MTDTTKKGWPRHREAPPVDQRQAEQKEPPTQEALPDEPPNERVIKHRRLDVGTEF
jgi:hypothetical protein